MFVVSGVVSGDCDGGACVASMGVKYEEHLILFQKKKTIALIPSQTIMSQTNKDLVDYIDIHHVKALNITAESNPEFLFGKYLNVIESRADPQIVLMISLLWQGR